MHATTKNERYAQFDDESIRALVHGFYGRVQEHPELAPVFDARIKEWPMHLERMVSFWKTVLGVERVYTQHPLGGPPQVHQAIGELERAHFKTWLGLWEENASTLFTPPLVEHLMLRAQHMARVLSGHLPEEGTARA